MIQTDFICPTLQQQFDAWKATPGGAHVLRHAYRITAGYAARWQRTRRQVSAKLIWELLRDRVTHLRAEFTRRGVALEKWDGFSLNNVFTAYVARHMMARRPDWAGLFETRQVGVERRRRVVVVTDFPSAARSAGNRNLTPEPRPVAATGRGVRPTEGKLLERTAAC